MVSSLGRQAVVYIRKETKSLHVGVGTYIHGQCEDTFLNPAWACTTRIVSVCGVWQIFGSPSGALRGGISVTNRLFLLKGSPGDVAVALPIHKEGTNSCFLLPNIRLPPSSSLYPSTSYISAGAITNLASLLSLILHCCSAGCYLFSEEKGLVSC